jgi:hypothetical protein
MIVAVGIGAFIAVKQVYQRYVIIANFRDALRDDVMGKTRMQPTSPRICLPWLALPLALIAGRNAASVFFRAGRNKRQIKRDLKAALLLERLQEGRKESFSLYLRSFSQEETLKRKKGIWWYLFLEGDIFGIDKETLDLLISSEVRRRYPMIAIGRPGDKLGAGRLPSSDSDWETLALLLMKEAKVIFIVPGTSRGVAWEMMNLKGYFQKTIYIMPPVKYYYGDKEEAEKHWSATQQEFVQHGFFFPDYDSKGGLLMLDESGRIAKSVPFENFLGGSRINELVGKTP